MKLIFSTPDFKVDGIPYPGFPILLNSRGRIVSVVLYFFIETLLNHVGARDIKTWIAYGQHIYDYFGYLEARGLNWRASPEGRTLSPISHYSVWCKEICKNAPGYINDKLRTIKRFYGWALENHYIVELPFRYVGGGSRRNGIWQESQRTNVDHKEHTQIIKVLSRSQAKEILSATNNPTHHAAYHLFLTSGLRAEELVTFPQKYVRDCRNFPSSVKSARVTLKKSDMDTKFDKERTIPVSVNCMDILWRYRSIHRPALAALSNNEYPNLFLNRYGEPFTSDGFNKPCERLSGILGFKFHPHMLRHTFATHTLQALEDLKSKKKLKGSPMKILQNFLGHSSLTTTGRYIHLLEEMNDEFGAWYQNEIDAVASYFLKKTNS